MSGVFRRRGEDTEIRGKEGHVRMGTGMREIQGTSQGILRSAANYQECCQLPEAGRDQEGFFTRALWGTSALTTPWDRSSGLHKCDKINSCCLKPRSWRCFIMRPQGTVTVAMKCSHQTTRGHCLPPNVDPIYFTRFIEKHIVFKYTCSFPIMISKLKCIL